MLNKKQIFNIVYAVALIGAVTSCIGILNELLQVVQLHEVRVTDFVTFKNDKFWIPFWFYLIGFLIGAAAVVFVLLQFKHPQKTRYTNIVLIVAMVLLLVLSFCMLYSFRFYWQKDDSYSLGYSSYLVIYTFRSSVMSLILHLGTILVCNIIDKSHCKKAASAEVAEESEN